MPKSITLCSPTPLNSKYKSGISIRIEELAKIFKGLGFKVVIIDKLTKKLPKVDFYYTLISTKPDSITSSLIKTLDKEQKLIVDLYTPILLEKVASGSYYGLLGSIKRLKTEARVAQTLRRGNHFIVANHRQKQYWLKTAKSFGVDLEKKDISVIPTGALRPLRTPTPNYQLRFTILWFGGIYPWMNPLPLLSAFSSLATGYPDWKLRILGGYHPKTGYAKIYDDIKRIAKSIPKNQIEFIPWQKADKLEKYLNDVAFAVHIPQKSGEDFYAHRVRLLTLLNHRIPVLSSGEDLISQLIVKYKAGMKIGPEHLAGSLQLLLENSRTINNMSKFCSKIQPLLLKETRISEKLK